MKLSTRFAIRTLEGPAEKEGNDILRFSGTSEPYYRVSERTANKVGVNSNGNPKMNWVTGLDPKKVQFYKWFSPDEQEIVKKQIEEYLPVIENYYGGKDVIDESNSYFWGEVRDVNRLSLTNYTQDEMFDLKSPVHALIYFSLIGGAFSELVAPTKEWAERNQIPHYVVMETDEYTEEDDDIITRSEAHAMLNELRNDPEAMFILAWCIQYDTTTYGAYMRSTSIKDLLKYHVSYIDGKLVTKKKKNTPKIFLEYANKWKGAKTRPLLYIEAYLKAGEYYDFIKNKEKRFVTAAGTVLGNTVEEAVTELNKPKFVQDLEVLRDQVEAKWKE